MYIDYFIRKDFSESKQLAFIVKKVYDKKFDKKSTLIYSIDIEKGQ